MANIIVNYDSLANVQTGLDGIYDQLDSMWDTLNNASTSITEISTVHDEVFSDVLSQINDQLEIIELSGLSGVEELKEKTGLVRDLFFDDEGNIISNLNNIPDNISEYFGFDEDPNGYIISQNTGATTSSDYETTNTDESGAYPNTGAVTGATAMTSSAPFEEEDEEKPEKITEQESEDETGKEETEDESSSETNNPSQTEDSNNSTTNNGDTNTSHDMKDSSTYETAKENAQKVGKETSKNAMTGTSGATTMGAALGAASAANGNTDSNNDNNPNDSETIKGEALGDTVIGDEELANEDDFIDIDSSTHKTSPIDVTIEKDSDVSVIPTLAGVAAAGLAGVSTKTILDKKDKDEDEEKDEGTFSGDYETAEGTNNNLLDSSDNIGFNPETIIEEGESSGLENNVYPSSVIEDIQSQENKDSGFDDMPALAGVAAAGLAGAGLAGIIAKENDEDEDEEKNPKDFE